MDKDMGKKLSGVLLALLAVTGLMYLWLAKSSVDPRDYLTEVLFFGFFVAGFVGGFVFSMAVEKTEER